MQICLIFLLKHAEFFGAFQFLWQVVGFRDKQLVNIFIH